MKNKRFEKLFQKEKNTQSKKLRNMRYFIFCGSFLSALCIPESTLVARAAGDTQDITFVATQQDTGSTKTSVNVPGAGGKHSSQESKLDEVPGMTKDVSVAERAKMFGDQDKRYLAKDDMHDVMHKTKDPDKKTMDIYGLDPVQGKRPHGNSPLLTVIDPSGQTKVDSARAKANWQKAGRAVTGASAFTAAGVSHADKQRAALREKAETHPRGIDAALPGSASSAKPLAIEHKPHAWDSNLGKELPGSHAMKGKNMLHSGEELHLDTLFGSTAKAGAHAPTPPPPPPPVPAPRTSKTAGTPPPPPPVPGTPHASSMALTGNKLEQSKKNFF